MIRKIAIAISALFVLAFVQFSDAGAVYYPYQGTGAYYKLVSAPPPLVGDVNNRIRVLVYDQNGRPAFGVLVIHAFGSGCPDECENFVFVGDAVQFNLGGGSHYRQPNDPPDRISIAGASDSIHVGNCDCIGWAHTDWQMTFQFTQTDATPTITPIPIQTITPSPSERCDILPLTRIKICLP